MPIASWKNADTNTMINVNKDKSPEKTIIRANSELQLQYLNLNDSYKDDCMV